MSVTDRERLTSEVATLLGELGADRTALLPILQEVKRRSGAIDDETMQVIADLIGIHPVEVHSVATFDAFLDPSSQGAFTLRLCRTISCDLAGKDAVARALESELGVAFGQTPTTAASLSGGPTASACAIRVRRCSSTTTRMHASRRRRWPRSWRNAWREYAGQTKNGSGPSARRKSAHAGQRADLLPPSMPRGGLCHRARPLAAGHHRHGHRLRHDAAAAAPASRRA